MYMLYQHLFVNLRINTYEERKKENKPQTSTYGLQIILVSCLSAWLQVNMDVEIFIYTLLWKLVTCLKKLMRFKPCLFQNQGTLVSSVDRYLV